MALFGTSVPLILASVGGVDTTTLAVSVVVAAVSGFLASLLARGQDRDRELRARMLDAAGGFASHIGDAVRRFRDTDVEYEDTTEHGRVVEAGRAALEQATLLIGPIELLFHPRSDAARTARELVATLESGFRDASFAWWLFTRGDRKRWEEGIARMETVRAEIARVDGLRREFSLAAWRGVASPRRYRRVWREAARPVGSRLAEWRRRRARRQLDAWNEEIAREEGWAPHGRGDDDTS